MDLTPAQFIRAFSFGLLLGVIWVVIALLMDMEIVPGVIGAVIGGFLGRLWFYASRKPETRDPGPNPS